MDLIEIQGISVDLTLKKWSRVLSSEVDARHTPPVGIAPLERTRSMSRRK